jgi:hypothetical protein
MDLQILHVEVAAGRTVVERFLGARFLVRVRVRSR